MSDACPTGFVSDCPARLVAEIMSDKWAIAVVWALHGRPRRHGELIDVIGGVSRKVLTHSLRRLQGYGLVDRTTRPARIEYRLTELGATLVEPIMVLTQWSMQHGSAITDHQEAARSDLDERPAAVDDRAHLISR